MLFCSKLIRLADNTVTPDSFSNRMRTKRFELFAGFASGIPRPLRILDVGGENSFWEMRGWANLDDVHLTILNIYEQQKRNVNITPIIGDATNLNQYADGSFDIVFSNSVMEHLFTLENQACMALEIRRVGKAYWVQTPNFWFPMEPHFLVPGWQWMPLNARVALLRRWKCGWRGPCSNRARALKLVKGIRLLTVKELRQLFLTAKIIPERFGGLVKSWTAIEGFPSR